jgi:hypothetical protein
LKAGWPRQIDDGHALEVEGDPYVHPAGIPAAADPPEGQTFQTGLTFVFPPNT